MDNCANNNNDKINHHDEASRSSSSGSREQLLGSDRYADWAPVVPSSSLPRPGKQNFLYELQTDELKLAHRTSASIDRNDKGKHKLETLYPVPLSHDERLQKQQKQSSHQDANRREKGRFVGWLPTVVLTASNVKNKNQDKISNIKFSLWKHICKLVEMGKKRYYLSLFCLSLFMMACFLVSLVISRSVGSDLEADDSSRSSGNDNAEKLVAQPEPMEKRYIYVVDLLESGKTFAYTRWRLEVNVPISTPIYKQQPVFIHRENMNERATATTEGLEGAASERGQVDDNSRGDYHLKSTRALANRSHNSEPDQAGGSLEQPNNSRSMTNPPVAQQSANNQQEPLNQLTIEKVKNSTNQIPSSVNIRNGLTLDPPTNIMLTGPDYPLDTEDPVQLAASDMNLNLKSLNSTIVDCFLVDTDKRYGQKIMLEDRHRRLSTTRRVTVSKMLAVIKACRDLTWLTLAGQTPQDQKTSPAIGFQKQASSITTGSVDQVASASTPAVSSSKDNSLNEIIKPVENRPQFGEQTHDFLSSILGPWLSPNLDSTTNRQLIQLDGQPSGSEPNPIVVAGQPNRVTPTQSTRMPNQPNPVGINEPDDESKRGSYLTLGMSMVNGIVPNTLWCGLGDRATNYSELGAEFKVDSCCRAHDHCPIRLRPFTSDYGLINWSVSTRSHCDCDVDFNDCLTSINSTLSNVIKTLYFRLVGLQCIDVQGRRQAATLTNGPASTN